MVYCLRSAFASFEMQIQVVTLIILLFCRSSAAHSRKHPHLNNATDQQSLLEFKSAITNDPHHSLANWNPNIFLCNWTGVTCSSRRERVVAVDVSGMGLEGSISPHLANLSFLHSFVVSNNSFSGHIPPQLGRLFRLKKLRLSRNSLEGQIPTSLSGCRNLVYLALSYNFLSGSIPAEVSLLPRLRFLYLGVNNLTGCIPSSLGNLSALTELELSVNNLEGAIPHQLGMLTNLSTLYLYENSLIGSIPSSLGNLSALTELELSVNSLQGAIPHQLGMLTSLSTLYLFRNELTGQIPLSFLNISALFELDISENNLTGVIPQEFGMLPNLQFLLLFENQLSGPIPTSLSNCTSLQELLLNQNQLTGHIPNEFGNNLLQLRYLYLWSNRLSGSIPISLGNCSKLAHLYLAYNHLSGMVPLELGKLHFLERLSLQHNQLVSSNTSTLLFLTAFTNCSHLQLICLHHNQLGAALPLSVGQLSPKLTFLSLGSNNIGGNIPPQIGNLTNLTYLDLSDNLFTGKIPSMFRRLQKMERLFLDDNRLEGSIFNEIDQMESLGLLSVSNNMLSGRIPDSLGHLQQQLRRLYLNHNQFSEKIPPSLGKCQNLELLDLSYNRLIGSIPQEVLGLQNLHFYLNLSWNSLQGSLPAEISKIVMALAIDISGNQLSGTIPEALGSCIALEYLNLSRNRLQGQIPMSLPKLQNLQAMDLSSNFLSGTVPKSFKRLKMLHYIDLSFNNLTGEISEGIFANSTIVALFVGNPALCGLHIYSLPACPKKRHQWSKKQVIVAIGVSIFILSCLILVSNFLWRHHLHRRNMNLSELLSTIAKNLEHPRISYQELVIATNGFDEANLLGVGNFGSVYKGILSNGTIIAAKVFNLDNEEARKSFDTECKVLKRVRHRNLVRVITSCSNLDFKILVMQFASNGSLEKHLYPDGNESDPKVPCGMSLGRRLDITIDIAHAMSYLHHDYFMQVVHCDLKPSNVLLDDDLTALVTDFGVARLIGTNSLDSSTSALTVRGSLGYLAPCPGYDVFNHLHIYFLLFFATFKELLETKANDNTILTEYGFGVTTSTKGDVYSFGIILLEMLTRKTPIDKIFIDGLTLQKWVYMAFPNRILEVVDSTLLTYHNDNDMDRDKMYNCLVQFIYLGLLCTNESPRERPNMREIVEMLERIKGKFFGDGRVSWLQSDMSYLLSRQIATTSNVKALESQSSSTL